MDSDNKEAFQEIGDIQGEMAQLFEEKQGLRGPVVPGKKIHEYISYWNEILERN